MKQIQKKMLLVVSCSQVKRTLLFWEGSVKQFVGGGGFELDPCTGSTDQTSIEFNYSS